ncbi:hypothetical protein JCM5353_008427 [Sporobolomyces roseus]
MFTQSLLPASVLLALATQVASHSIVTGLYVNGVDKSDFKNWWQGSSYMRVPPTNDPIKDMTSPYMACGNTKKVDGVLTVKAGDTLEAQWWHDTTIAGKDPLATSHSGPMTAMISPLSWNGQGSGWVQIASEGYYHNEGKWATNRMIENGGKQKAVIPKSLAPGEYLVRFDFIALHMGGDVWSPGREGGAQYYPRWWAISSFLSFLSVRADFPLSVQPDSAQIKVTGNGNVKLPSGVAIPGLYTKDTPGVVQDIFSNPGKAGKNYIVPGTGNWDGSAHYSKSICHEAVSGFAAPGFCQGGSKKRSEIAESPSRVSSTGHRRHHGHGDN